MYKPKLSKFRQKDSKQFDLPWAQHNGKLRRDFIKEGLYMSGVNFDVAVTQPIDPEVLKKQQEEERQLALLQAKKDKIRKELEAKKMKEEEEKERVLRQRESI